MSRGVDSPSRACFNGDMAHTDTTTRPANYCGACETQFTTDDDFFFHDCDPSSRFVRTDNGFGGVTSVKREETTPYTDADIVALIQGSYWARKFEVGDITRPLKAYALAWATTYEGTFSFMLDMRADAVAGKWSDGKAKGTLNCVRAEVLRSGAVRPVPVASVAAAEKLTQSQAEELVRAIGRKLDTDDVTPALQAFAQEWAATYSGTFQFMLDMQLDAIQGRWSAGKAKGVLNCLRADMERNAPMEATGDEMDLTTLPASAHGLLRAAVQAEDGTWIFLVFAQKRRSGIAVLQEVGGNDDLFLGQHRKGEAGYRGKRAREVALVLADPNKAITAYGLEFTRCGICGTQLTEDSSKERGIGPKCAAKHGY